MTGTQSYTPDELAKILKITRFTVYEMIKRGDFAGLSHRPQSSRRSRRPGRLYQ